MEQRKKGVCTECGEEKELHAFRKCFKCYRKTYKQPIVTCKKCGNKKVHHGKGLCDNCYLKTFSYDIIKGFNVRKLHNISLELWKEITKECLVCGFNKVVDLHHIDQNRKNSSRDNLVGLCPNHHKMVHDERYSVEIKELIKKKLEAQPI